MEPITLAPHSNIQLQFTVVASLFFLIVSAGVLYAKRQASPKKRGDILAGCLIATTLGFLAVSVYIYAKAGEEYESRVISALEQQFNYRNVQLDGSSFTASHEGMYVKGEVIHLHGNTYIKVLDSD